MKYLSITLVLFFSACVTGGALGPISYETVDNHHGFRNQILEWGGVSRGLETRVYMRGLNDGGYVRICSYYVDDQSGTQKVVIREWLDNAYFMHKNSKILSARFIKGQPKSVGAKAGCVTSTTLVKDVGLDNLYIEGQRITVFF